MSILINLKPVCSMQEISNDVTRKVFFRGVLDDSTGYLLARVGDGWQLFAGVVEPEFPLTLVDVVDDEYEHLFLLNP